jgi:signal transduction histidine kinase/sensor domain CHASE-containing protein
MPVFSEQRMGFLKKLIRYKELVLLLLAGLALIMIVDAVLVQGFHKDERYREKLTAERLQAQVQSSLEEHVTALIALKVVYQNFTDITHYDFQQYGKSITSTLHGFQRLMYIDPTLTIRQVYPLSPENTGLYGYSLTKQPAMQQTLLLAKNSQSPTTSRLIPFLNHPKSFWAFIPIYRNNNKEFLGFAAGEISLDRIWQPFGQYFSQYQIQLKDPQGVKLFEHININSKSPTVSEFQFNLLGQQWTIQLNPVNPATTTLLLQRGSLWLGGLLILVLLTMIVLSSKRHKIELEEAQKQFETIFEASPDGILLLDGKLNLKITNPVVREWLGKTEEELANKTFFELFECQCPNLKKCGELSHVLCTSKQFAVDLPDVLETRIIDPPNDNAPKTLRLNASRISQERNGKKEEGFICVLGDISTSKELDRVKETYVATLTHDLKTPLLAQQMVLETLASGSIGPINEEQKKLLIGAKESVHDLVEMVNSTLLFYKLEASHVALHRQRVQLSSVVKDVMSGLQPLAEKREVTLELDTALELPEAWIDAIQMKRVFHNIISNAISYSRRSTPIRVSIYADDKNDGTENRLLVEVCNQGKGIAPEELPKIFDKYYSISRKFKQIGTGLGLYISKKIVELHGGKIWAISEPEKETRFYISLPVVQQVEKSSKGQKVEQTSVSA